MKDRFVPVACVSGKIVAGDHRDVIGVGASVVGEVVGEANTANRRRILPGFEFHGLMLTPGNRAKTMGRSPYISFRTGCATV